MDNLKYYLGFHIVKIDTHVEGTLTECSINHYGSLSREKILIDNIVFPKEIFLYWCLKRIFIPKTLKKKDDFTHFDYYFDSLINPTQLKIGGLYKKQILGYRDVYDMTVAILAVDENYGKIDISTKGAWNYSFGQLIVRKSLLETIIKNLNPTIVFPTIWTDIEYRLKKLKPKINFSVIMAPYRQTILNAFDLILNSPVTVLFSNALKMIAPTFEGVIKDYIIFKRITGIKTSNLSTIVGGISQYQGPHFSNEFKEYLRIILEPTRNLLLHGGVPSESVCNYMIVIILEMLEEILKNEND